MINNKKGVLNTMVRRFFLFFLVFFLQVDNGNAASIEMSE
jgi:hypothetical protein